METWDKDLEEPQIVLVEETKLLLPHIETNQQL